MQHLVNFTLAYLAIPSQPSQQVAIELAIQDVNQVSEFPFDFQLHVINGTYTQSGVVQMYDVARKAPMVAMIGPSNTNLASVVGPMASADRLALLSPSVTSVSMDATYPESFDTFFRLIPDNNEYNQAVEAIVNHFQFPHLVILRDQSSFAIDAVAQMVMNFQSEAQIFQAVCIDQTSCHHTLQKMVENHMYVFVLIGLQKNIVTILRSAVELHLFVPGYVWMGTDTMRAAVGALQNEEKVAVTGLLALEPIHTDELKALNLQQRWLEYSPETFPLDGFTMDILFSYDSIWAVAHTLLSLYQQNGELPSSGLVEDRSVEEKQEVVDVLKNISFSGVSGNVTFSHDRRREALTFRALNYGGIAGWTEGLLFQANPEDSSTLAVSHQQRIVWPGKTLSIPTGTTPFSQVVLQVAAKHYPPYIFYHEEDDSWSGPNVEILQYVSENTGIQINITKVSMGTSSMVKMLADPESPFDIAVAGIVQSLERLEFAEFSRTLFQYELDMAAKSSRVTSTENDLFGFLKPFHWTVWAMIGFCIFLTAIVFNYVSREEEELHDKSEALMAASVGLLGTDTGDIPWKAAPDYGRRLLALGALVLSNLLYATYTANLVNFLKVESSELQINSWNDLEGFRVGTNSGGITEREVKAGVPIGTLIELYDNTDLLLDALNRGEIDIAINPADKLKYLSQYDQRYCDIHVLGISKLRSPVGFMFRKDLDPIIYGEFDRWIIDLTGPQLQGLSSIQENLGNPTCTQEKEASDSAQNSEDGQLTVGTLGGVFTFYFAVLCVAVYLHIRGRRRRKEPVLPIIFKSTVQSLTCQKSLPETSTSHNTVSVEILST